MLCLEKATLINMEVQIKLLDPRLRNGVFDVPQYSTSGSAAMDLRAMVEENIAVRPTERILIPTGIAIHIERKVYAGLIFPRSGLGHDRGIILGNSAGLIDSDYQGEIKVSLWNTGFKLFEISPGDRIAQLMILPVQQVKFAVVQSFENSERGDGGFGSTGRT